MYTIPCPRCAGSGKLWEHSTVMGGVCFQCRGAKTVQTTKSPEAREKAAAKKEAKATADKAQMAARIAEGNAKLAALVETYKEDARIPTRVHEFPAVMAECVRLLDRIDRGEIKTFQLS